MKWNTLFKKEDSKNDTPSGGTHVDRKLWEYPLSPAPVTGSLLECAHVEPDSTYPGLALSLPGSKKKFSQPFKEKCISVVVRIASEIIFHLSQPKPSSSYCVIIDEAAGKI